MYFSVSNLILILNWMDGMNECMNNYMQTDWMMAIDWKNKQEIKWMDGWIDEQTNKQTN